jgi:cytochrome c-type biogenesis protein CcmH
MSADARDALEHEIRCQCGCTLDVYTCRTTDFSCQVSPAMHRDVIALVEGGYSAQEILDAFVDTYGERALMSPRREGFNWAGYLVPFAALGAGAAAVAVVLRGMQRRTAAAAAPAPRAPGTQATPEELARLDAAIRRDD